MGVPKFTFGLVLFASQIILLALFAKYAEYPTVAKVSVERHGKFYTQFIDIHTMVFVGFALLMTFLKRYGFSAMSQTMLLCAVAVQWAILFNAWIKQRIEKNKGHISTDPMRVELSVDSLITADFTAAAVMISFGAVIGKASRLQLLIMAIVETIFYAINENLIVEYLHITDVGGSIAIHLFGAYFGLAVSAVLQNTGKEHPNEDSVYHSDMFSMIGTLFLWVLWPSFNSGPVGDSPFQQNRAVINTYLSLSACVATSFLASSVLHKEYKFKMSDIQNATLAGGVAVGASANLLVNPWGAILIGMIGGIISVLGFTYVTPFMAKHIKIHDTCGVHNLHGMPAIFAGIAGSVAAASIDNEKYPDTDFANLYPKVVEGRSMGGQAGFMFAAVLVAFTISVVGGAITGLLIRFLDSPKGDMLFSDENEWEVPGQIITHVTVENDMIKKNPVIPMESTAAITNNSYS